MLYKKANWLLSSAVEQTNQWRLHYEVSVESLDDIYFFLSNGSNYHLRKRLKNERGRNFKIQNEQYQSPSSKTQVSPHISTILKDPARVRIVWQKFLCNKYRDL